MQKYLLSLLCCFVFTAKVIAQDTTVEKTATVLDTAAILQDLLNLLDSADNPSSYGLVSVGFSNRLFSLHNNQLNAKQSTTSTLVYSPSLGYFHKSGFSLSAGLNLLHDKNNGLSATQYSITPAFDLTSSKDWSAGISYSRYFISDKYSTYASPIQNDLYAYASYKKHWIEPGIALGFSTGNFTEIFKLKGLNGNEIIDSGTYHIRSFSMVASVSHDFQWNRIFGDADGLGLTPTLQMNFASDSTQSISHTIGPNLLRFLSRRRRIAKLQGKNSFQAQSVALSLDLNYSIGNFTVLPQLYLDYYLPETDEKKFTQTFTLSVGYSF
ncbi:MAG: hypothetical protein IPP72_03095 [Chitinophagaceae bacterium]|nr:hypothetical protein [Chitinophagaceae bacterium]